MVLKACDAIRRKLFGSSSETVGGRVRENAGGNSLEAAFKQRKLGAIEEYAEFLPPGAKPDAIKISTRGSPLSWAGRTPKN